MDGEYDVKIRAVPEYLEQRVGLLASQKANHVHFLHRSFQEYLAACELTCRDPDKRRPPVQQSRRFPNGVVARAYQAPDLWENVVLLAGDVLAGGREDDLWKLVLDLCHPYLRNQGDARGALLALTVAERRALLAACCDEFDPRAPILDALRRTAARVFSEARRSAPDSATLRAGCWGATRIRGTTGGRGGAAARWSADIDWVHIPEVDPATGQREFIYGDRERRREAEFWIARYPVTYAQFQAFVKAADGFGNPAWWEGWRRMKRIARGRGSRASHTGTIRARV